METLVADADTDAHERRHSLTDDYFTGHCWLKPAQGILQEIQLVTPDRHLTWGGGTHHTPVKGSHPELGHF